MADSRPRHRVDWSRVRDQYVCGAESYAAIAKRLGVSVKALEHRARGDGSGSWAELRRRHRAELDAAPCAGGAA